MLILCIIFYSITPNRIRYETIAHLYILICTFLYVIFVICFIYKSTSLPNIKKMLILCIILYSITPNRIKFEIIAHLYILICTFLYVIIVICFIYL